MVCATWVLHIAVLTWKKYNLKVQNDVVFLKCFFGGPLLRSIDWEPAFHRALRNCSKGLSEEPGYTGTFP